MKTFILCFVAILSFISHGQRTRVVVDSVFFQNKLKGIAHYNVLESDPSVFHGEFSFSKSFEDTVGNINVNNIIYKGNYNKDKKEGKWLYEYDRLRPANVRFVKDLKIVQPGIGERKVVNGYFRNDIAEDDWQVSKKTVSSSQDVDSMFITKARFKNNAIVGDFYSWCDSLTIKGEINEDGFLEGNWVFTQKTRKGSIVEEHRTYDNGILIDHKFIRDGKEYAVNHVGLDQTIGGEGEEWVEVEITKSYFDIIFQTNFGVDEDLSRDKTNLLINKSNDFLKYSIFSYGVHDEKNIWLIKENDKGISYPKLRVRKFEYTQEEKEQLKDALLKIKESEEIISSYLDDSQVEINRHAYRDISLYYEVYMIYQQELEKIKSVFERLNLPAFEYVDRSEILPLLTSSIVFPEKIKFEYEDKVHEEKYMFPSNLSSSAFTLDLLYKTLLSINQSLLKTSTEIKPIIKRNKTKAQIASLEKELVKKKEMIQALYVDKHNDENYNEYHSKYSESVLIAVDNEFKSYSRKEVTERIELIQQLLTCFDNYISFYDFLIGFSANIKRIEELYTRVVWNPFTFTDMEEIVKERVFNSYKNHLLDYIINDLYKQMSCEQIQVFKNNAQEVFKRMKQLREQDTKELERSLRRQQDTSIVIELFELNFEQ